MQLISVASRIDGVLQDLSQTGARISLCSPPPRQGRDVLLRWPGQELFGQIVWSNGLDVGVAFHSPISHEELVETVGRDLPPPLTTSHSVL
ncbi:hypothetical protein AQZ52_06675 [Novosphingobium fuchskuhlense]|uniref:PilZ domain-containing protein n=1 Tax=Novosphingobium fuchskuhlense TaxID=1117702 RepID=A0A117UXW6_9SPHN|nr:hypothetical protein AQZ52_06675 [Novosphingobium fuchskuhlense]